jgi:regulator of protease activity HflC (stomatin/prohibitin superfamily)
MKIPIEHQKSSLKKRAPFLPLTTLPATPVLSVEDLASDRPPVRDSGSLATFSFDLFHWEFKAKPKNLSKAPMFQESAKLLVWLISVVTLAVIILPQVIRILREYERGVVFRLGKLLGPKGPGLIFLIPIVDRMVRMDLRVVTTEVPRQELLTRDNVPMTVDAVVYFRVIDPAAAVVRVENYLKATWLISQTTLRSVLGQAELDELLSQRDKVNLRLQEIIDRQTEPWGIKVTAVEVRDIVLPDRMKRAMAGQAESERERRAKIINAEGEFQGAAKLVQAASMISAQPIALQLRFLQTIRESSNERSHTTMLPVPVDLFAPFIKRFESQQSKEP